MDGYDTVYSLYLQINGKMLFVHREDMVIIENVDFVYYTHLTVLPMGALCEIDCDNATFSILEPGVR